MITKKILIGVAGVALMLSSCDVKDPIYNTSHPDKARITVTTNWSGIGQGIAKPAEYYAAYGMEEKKITQDEYTFELFDPGTHTIYFYNKPEGVAISQHTATASYASPIGWFFTGRLQKTVVEDTDYAFTLPMKQQVRELTLVIEPTGGTIVRIASITGTLSGAAGTLDFDSNTHGTPANITLAFAKDTDGKYKATVHLLGITGNIQDLDIAVTYNDGSPADQLEGYDLSTLLADFNSDKETPLTLGSQIVETPYETGFTATIKSWRIISGTGTAD